MKTLNKTRVYAAIAATTLLLTTSCSDEQEMSGNDTLVTLAAGIGEQPSTRIDFGDQGTGGVALAWSSEDRFSLYRVNGQNLPPATFTLKSGEGTKNGIFQGDMPGGSEGTYVAYYPAGKYTGTATNGEVTAPTVTGQTQNGNERTAHLAAFTFMKATASDLQSPLSFSHLMAMLTFDFTMPGSYATDEAPTSLTLTADADVFFTTTDNGSSAQKTNTLTLTLTDVTIDNSTKKLKAYMMVTGGTTLNHNTLTFGVKTNKNQYTYTTSPISTVYNVGTRYTGTVAAADWTVNPINTGIGDITDGGSMTATHFANEGMPGIDGTTADRAYAIANASQLAELAKRINGDDTDNWNTKFYKLTADIDLAAAKICGDATTMGGAAKSWTPIGNYSKEFKGTFDGSGHTVKGLYINATTGVQGLFGVLNAATVKDVKIDGGDITSSAGGGCGGVAAVANNSSILGCSYVGQINANKNAFTGGIAGDVTSAFIAGCSHEGNIESKSCIGGIVGRSAEVYIVGCRNNGNLEITGLGWAIGGIIGITGNSNEINGCCSAGNVKGDTKGGIVGRGDGNCIVDACFFVKSSDAGSAENINGGGSITNYHSSAKNSISELNQVVYNLNNGIIGWNGRDEQTKFCNYTFTEGNPAESTMPTISAN